MLRNLAKNLKTCKEYLKNFQWYEVKLTEILKASLENVSK